MIGISLNRIVFNDGTEVNLSSTDIVVLVGPNNAGKSRSLKDINNAIVSPRDTIVASDVTIQYHQAAEIGNKVKEMSLAHRRSDQSVDYQGYKYSIHQSVLERIGATERVHDQLRGFLVSSVTTEERLDIANPKPVIERGQPKQKPLQYMAEQPIRNAVSNVFNRVYNQHVYCYDKATTNIYLHIGEEIGFNHEGMSPEQITDRYYECIEALPKLEEQGDGVRSLAGLLINLMMPNYSMFLIDEPEAFLHPPQARTLGGILPELLKDKQAFISTHSIDLIKGLLTSARDRVRIIRITRNGNTNHIKLLGQEDLDTIWDDPIMRHSNMIDCLFYEHTVLCESDSDCQLYALALDHLKEMNGQRSDTLFIHCGGKGRMHLVSAELKALGVDYRIIPDIDVFNDKSLIKRLIEANGGDWVHMNADYDMLATAMNSPGGTMTPKDFINALRMKIEQRGYKTIAKAESKRISDDAKGLLENRWDALKHNGINYIHDTRVKAGLERLITAMNQLKIYPVKEGELENFVPKVGDHGPGWVMKVIEDYPDLGNDVYDELKIFVNSWGL